MKSLTEHNSWLKNYSLAQSEIVKWKSKDGTEVEGVLTKPVDYTSGKVPFEIFKISTPSV